MPIINPDLSAVGPIQPGMYPAKIVAVEVKESKKGNPMIVVELDVDIGGGQSKTRTGYHVISGAGAFNFDQLLRACHFDSVANAYMDPAAAKPPFDTDELVGQSLMVQFESDVYDGRPSDKIVSYLKKT